MPSRESVWELQVFAEVVDRGSIAAASRVLRVSPSAVSKRLAALEARLGARLVQRTTRSLRVTPEGAALRERVGGVFTAIEAAEAVVGQQHQTLTGRLRITAPTLLGNERLAPLLAEFCRRHPGLEVDLDVTDRFVDLIAEPVDVAVRVAARLPASGLSVRRWGRMPWVVAASPTYLNRVAPLTRPGQLASVACLESSHAAERGAWVLHRGERSWRVRVEGPFTCSGLGGLRHAVLAGLGVAQLPRWFIAADLAHGQLVEVLPRYRLAERSAWLVTPSRAFVPPRVRALTEFLLAHQVE